MAQAAAPSAIGSNYDPAGFTALPALGTFSDTVPAGLTPATSGPSNADITDIIVTGNTPPSDIQLNVTSLAGSGSEAVDQPVSPITLAELPRRTAEWGERLRLREPVGRWRLERRLFADRFGPQRSDGWPGDDFDHRSDRW